MSILKWIYLSWIYRSIANRYSHNRYIHIYSYENGHIGLDISVARGIGRPLYQDRLSPFTIIPVFLLTPENIKRPVNNGNE
jgi:hypothetical protein